jgi:hypothetical protein
MTRSHHSTSAGFPEILVADTFAQLCKMGNSNLTNNHGLRVRRDGPCTPTLRHTGHLEKHYGAKVVLLKIEAEAEELMQLRGQPQLHAATGQPGLRSETLSESKLIRKTSNWRLELKRLFTQHKAILFQSLPPPPILSLLRTFITHLPCFED